MCPFCHLIGRRKNAICIRYDFRPVCWFMRIVNIHTIVIQYGGGKNFGLHYMKDKNAIP